uniref:Putative secreted protein n=1 Tax=Amblyomma triste TaxID=251400 RepID=A0A023G9W8_AMBTT
MKKIIAALCVFSIVAASAYKVAHDDAVIDVEAKHVATEAILVGQVLQETARQLAEDETLGSEVDEYFIGKLLGKIKNAIGAVVATAGDVLKGAGDKIGSFSMQEKLEDRTTKILTKVLEKSTPAYSAQDYSSRAHSVKNLSARLETLGRRITEQGEKILNVYDTDV